MDIELGNDTDLAYVVKTPAGHVYSIYKNGMATGFPEGSFSINKAALYDLGLHAKRMRLAAALRDLLEVARCNCGEAIKGPAYDRACAALVEESA